MDGADDATEGRVEGGGEEDRREEEEGRLQDVGGECPCRVCRGCAADIAYDFNFGTLEDGV